MTSLGTSVAAHSVSDGISTSPVNIAICLHIFYPDVAEKIILSLSNIDIKFTLFITHSSPLPEEIIHKLKSLYVEKHFIKTENYGMDVYPFLKVLNHPELHKYEYICKIHTKKGRTAEGVIWRETMLDAVIGSTNNIRNIVNHFEEDPRLALVGPESTYLSARQFMYANQKEVEHLIACIYGRSYNSDWGFFAGTMFWARRSFLRHLAGFVETETMFYESEARHDGDTAHAVERLFGAVPHFLGGKIALIENDQKIVHKLKTLDGIGSPSREAITRILERLSYAQAVYGRERQEVVA